MNTAYPLDWPVGWHRTPADARAYSRFSKEEQVRTDTGSYTRRKELTVNDATLRVLDALSIMRISRETVVVSTNLELRNDGLPRSGQRKPADPGAAVYWRKGKDVRCMAVDRYNSVEGNLAAIAATLEAMRAIDRYGGAVILDRAFMGFAALPNLKAWWQVFGFKGPTDVTEQDIKTVYRTLASERHPDTGGSEEAMAELNRAREQGLEAIR